MALAYNNLGGFLCDHGRYDEGGEMFTQALSIYEETLPPNHWHPAHTRSLYGLCLTEGGRYERAEELLLEAHAVLNSVQNWRAELTVRYLVQLYEAWGKSEKAAEYRTMLATK